MAIETVWERNYRAGYKLIRKRYTGGDAYGGPDFEMTSAYNPNGDYIGLSIDAHRLVVKRGIAPEKARSDHKTCSIGFCEKDQKWYGWSHRAIVGFGIGDRIFEEDYGDDNTLFVEHGREVIETLEHAKTAAINFAEYVS